MGYDVATNIGEHCWGNVGDFSLTCVNWQFHGQVGVGNTGEMSRTHMCSMQPLQSEIDAAAAQGIDINPSGVVDPLFGVPLGSLPLCYTARPHTELCRWDGHCASPNGCERDSSQCLADDGQAPDGTICTTDAQCGGFGGQSICYYAGFLSAVAGVNTKICRPPGTERDWCERNDDCDHQNLRGYGVFTCNDYNECMHTATASPRTARRAAPTATASPTRAPAGRDFDGTGNINRRFCRSRGSRAGGGLGNRRPTNKNGHPTLSLPFDPAITPGEHCFGNANDFTLVCHDQDGANYCENNICYTDRVYTSAQQWPPVRVGHLLLQPVHGHAQRGARWRHLQRRQPVRRRRWHQHLLPQPVPPCRHGVRLVRRSLALRHGRRAWLRQL